MSDSTISTVLDNTSETSTFRWPKVVELGYVEDSIKLSGEGPQHGTKGVSHVVEKGVFPTISLEEKDHVCFNCGKTAEEASLEKLSRCAKCQVASYCSRNCQVKNWKGGDGVLGHKFSCEAYKRVGDDMMFVYSDDKDMARQDVLTRIRFYAYPYAVHKASKVGRGFLFLQSNSSLAILSLPLPVLSNGRKYPKQRSILLHWLTIKEYDSEVCMSDFELAMVRKELKSAVDSYDETVEIPVFMRFRCGHVAVGLAPLVPDFQLCKKLGKEYYGSGEGAEGLQLDIDDI